MHSIASATNASRCSRSSMLAASNATYSSTSEGLFLFPVASHAARASSARRVPKGPTSTTNSRSMAAQMRSRTGKARCASGISLSSIVAPRPHALLRAWNLPGAAVNQNTNPATECRLRQLRRRHARQDDRNLACQPFRVRRAFVVARIGRHRRQSRRLLGAQLAGADAEVMARRCLAAENFIAPLDDVEVE